MSEYSKNELESISLYFQKSLFFNYIGKALFAKASEFNDEKFGTIMHRVLLPMALDYHLRSREIDVNDLAIEKMSKLNGDENQKDETIQVWMLLLFVSFLCVCLFLMNFKYPGGIPYKKGRWCSS